MGKTLEERVARLEAHVSELLTTVQADGKDIKKLKRELKRLSEDRDRLEREVRLLKRDI